jgi:hypothetical protein
MLELIAVLKQENKDVTSDIHVKVTGENFVDIKRQVEYFIQCYNIDPPNGEKLFDWYFCEMNDIIGHPIKIEVNGE